MKIMIVFVIFKRIYSKFKKEKTIHYSFWEKKIIYYSNYLVKLLHLIEDNEGCFTYFSI